MPFLKKIDNNKLAYILIGLFFFVLLFGFISLFSSSIVVAEKRFGDKYYYLFRQLVLGIIPSIILFLGFAFVLKNKYIKKWSMPFFFATLIAMIAVIIPGIGLYIGGSRGWLNLGFTTLQPSEFFKLGSILFMAFMFERMGPTIKDFKYGFIPYIVYFGFCSLLIILEPDLAMMITYFVISTVVFFVAGAKKSHLALILGTVVLAVLVFLNSDSGGARNVRIQVFLHPEQYGQRDEAYHIDQAMIAVGTGGVFGKGIGKSVQKFSYLPEVIGDSIFAVIAEEFGFISVSIFLCAYFFIIYSLFTVASRASDNFSKYFLVGFATWLGFQAFTNIGAMLRLLPLTGVTLPLVSYGSTSLWAVSIAFGISINMAFNATKSIKDRVGSISDRKSRITLSSKNKK